MKCCVESCRNNTKHGSMSRGISFLKFTRDPVARAQWLRAFGKPAGVKGKALVCTEHFCNEDLRFGENGEVSVRAGAMPRGFEVCRICLSTDQSGTFHDLHAESLSRPYEVMSGISVDSPSVLPARLCGACASRLLRHARFRDAALAAQRALVGILGPSDHLTPQHIEEIQRFENRLLPQLTYKHHEPQYYVGFSQETHHLQSDGTNTIPLHEVNINIEAKADDAGEFYHENETQDSIKSEVNSLRNSDENPIADTYDDNAFSSDDDRPILQQKKKKKLTKKANHKGVTVKKKKEILNKEPKTDRRKKLIGDDLDAAIFVSSHLNAEEQIAEFQKRMLSANYKNAVHKCGSCYKGFLDEDAYNNHMVRHTDQCGAHECAICRIRFKQPHALRNHVTSHMQKFTCKCCPYVTFRKQTAKLHEEWHNGTRYQCPHCQEEFLKFTTYMGHIRIKHPSDCVCQLCGYSFVSDKGLRLHTKLKHRLDEESVIPEDGPFCERCGVRFLSAEALRRHIQVSARHHQGDENDAQKSAPQKRPRKQRGSKDCAKETTDGEQKRKRPVALKPEGPIPCEQCNMQLEDSRAYYKHFRRMHPDKNRTNYPSMKSPCMCERCGRMFQTLALLVDHAHVHSGERHFRCALCGKRFQQRQRLVAHAHVHRAQRARYACALCGKRFSTHSNRQRHAFSHTGLKPFKCEMCGKCFKHASEKRAHVAYVHLKKPWPKRARHKRGRDEAPGITREPPQREIEIAEPQWAACSEPKLDHTLPDRPMYYNLKI